MQEDKTSKWLAAELRKQQEENPLPYELGAWEAFEKKRNAPAEKKHSYYWLSGIAASLVLLLVAGGLWLSRDMDESGSDTLTNPIALEEKSAGSDTPLDSNSSEPQDMEAESPVLGSNEMTESDPRTDTPPRSSKGQNTQKIEKDKISSETPSGSTEKLAVIEEKVIQESSVLTDPRQTQTALAEKAGEEPAKTEVPEKVIASAELPKEPELSDEEIKEILDSKSFATIIMGLSPGFGASSGSEQTTSGASMGLGVMVDMEITGKLVLGSGLAVNYLNQASESQNYAQVAGFASPVTETNEIAQVQVDIPFYFKYPITRNRSVSVQAGFSNLVTFNQYAQQESSYTRQIAVNDGSAANSFTLRSESVNQAQDLSVPSQRFYPLATANLGVTFRLYESKKTSYEVMPFYNYPLQEFSGYGEKLGMFGASFKVNFGAIERK